MSEITKEPPMRLISLINRIRSGWLAALATTAVVALAAPGNAQTVPPPPASALPSADLAKVHLTAARNALSDVTQLPAAAQLTGETRTRVQQLITSFNDLIGKSDWRGPYAKVEASLSTLLGSETSPAPATATPSAVGTSGAAADLDPAIRAKLVEFRAHLDMFKTAASAAAPAPAAPPPAAAAPPAAATPSPTAPPAREPAPTPPATMPPAPTAPTAAPTPPPTAPPPTSPDPRPDAPSPADAGIDDRQDVSGVARDLLLHVEALEVILGAQARVQKEATAAAGGAVVSSQTPSGSTRTTVTGPDVTLSGLQLEQIMTRLAEMRRLLEKK
jgi:hypothetical protein